MDTQSAVIHCTFPLSLQLAMAGSTRVRLFLHIYHIITPFSASHPLLAVHYIILNIILLSSCGFVHPPYKVSASHPKDWMRPSVRPRTNWASTREMHLSLYKFQLHNACKTPWTARHIMDTIIFTRNYSTCQD